MRYLSLVLVGMLVGCQQIVDQPNQPQQTVIQPGPVFVQPAPVYVQPAPIYVQPAPRPRPLFGPIIIHDHHHGHSHPRPHAEPPCPKPQPPKVEPPKQDHSPRRGHGKGGRL